MQGMLGGIYIPRHIEKALLIALQHLPVKALIGPRQCGKSMVAGAEIDFVMRYDHKIFAIECKSSLSPQLTKGFYNGIEDINPDYSFVASPVSKGWEVSESVKVVSISELIDSIQGENLTI
jgi:hypothetical protein